MLCSTDLVPPVYAYAFQHISDIVSKFFTQTFPGCADEREFENEIFENEVQLSKDKQTLHACV